MKWVARTPALFFAASGLLIACGGGAPVYAVCEGASDCNAPADGCYDLQYTRSDNSAGSGTMCTLTCESDDDCPSFGMCLSVGTDTSSFLCYATCQHATHCFAGTTCTRVDSSTGELQVCLPDQ